MAMVELQANRRPTTGTGVCRKILAGGRVPGVVYGKRLEARALDFDRRELEKFLGKALRGTVVVRMEIRDGEEAKEAYSVLKEVQKDPLTDRVIHVDFYEVAFGQKFRVDIPLRLQGKAAGIELGGILEQVVRTVEVECIPSKVPEFLALDVTSLGIGDSFKMEDIAFPEGVAPVEKDLSQTVVAVHAPRTEEVAAAAPEVGEEAAEGASVAEPEESESEK